MVKNIQHPLSKYKHIVVVGDETKAREVLLSVQKIFNCSAIKTMEPKNGAVSAMEYDELSGILGEKRYQGLDHSVLYLRLACRCSEDYENFLAWLYRENMIRSEVYGKDILTPIICWAEDASCLPSAIATYTDVVILPSLDLLKGSDFSDTAKILWEDYQ